ncbi:MAG: galactosyltransferase-related protein [Planctomycetota bacterium]|nr:galactosyltransferase-related protein [Planctomycetota bacterium]
MLAVIVSTHTPRGLARTLLGLGRQTSAPGVVVVTCDGENADVRDIVLRSAADWAFPVLLVMRAHQGEARLAQNRNNAVRALLEHLPALAREPERGAQVPVQLAFLDGDCCPAPDWCATHLHLAGKLVLAHRVELSPEQTEAFDESAVRAGRPPAAIASEQLEALERRERRSARQLWLRRLGLNKAHKPKVLGANVSLPMGTFLAINGFDEGFAGWGAEDDDLARRAYAAGCKPALAVTLAIVYHQWHPTRAPGSWHENAGAGRFKARLAARCAQGLDAPKPQSEPRVEVVRDGLAALNEKLASGAGQRAPLSKRTGLAAEGVGP